MSLRPKILTILLLVVLPYVAVDYVVQRWIIYGSFADLEREQAAQELNRVLAGVQRELRELDELALDWARTSRPTPPAVDGGAAGRVPSAGSDVDLLCRWDADQDGLRGWATDPASGEPIDLEELAAGLAELGAEAESGLWATARGLLLLSVQRVESADGTVAAESGRWLVGRFLGHDRMQQIAGYGRITFDIAGFDGHPPSRQDRELLEIVMDAGEPVFDDGDADLLHVYAALRDARGEPALLLRVSVPRELSERAWRTVGYSLRSTLAAALLILLVLLLLLDRVVTRPLAKLARHAVDMRLTENTAARTGMKGSDEIAQLAREFDKMVESLGAEHAKLMKTARLAGMSEVATGILHNVGNVLNTVNVSTHLLGRNVQQLATDDLELMVSELEDHQDDLGHYLTEDPQGTHLLPLLSALTRAFGEHKGELAKELDSVEAGIEHIREIVRSQQSYAGKVELSEPTSLAEQVDAAVNIAMLVYDPPENLAISREYEDLPWAWLDKHKLTGILVNLLVNAQEAMSDRSITRPHLTLRLVRVDRGLARIEISDNGMGISAGNVAQVFTQGFTSREGRTGLGLHVATNFASEIGGSLQAHSAGPGKGATFVLDVPLQTDAARIKGAPPPKAGKVAAAS